MCLPFCPSTGPPNDPPICSPICSPTHPAPLHPCIEAQRLRHCPGCRWSIVKADKSSLCHRGVHDRGVPVRTSSFQPTSVWGDVYLNFLLGECTRYLSSKSSSGLFFYPQDSTSGEEKLSPYAAGRSYPFSILSPVPVKKVGSFQRENYT